MDVYKITCLTNGRYYIGRTQDHWNRFNDHKSDLRLGKHKNKALQIDYDLYGLENFKFEVLGSQLTKEMAFVNEWKLIYGAFERKDALIYNKTLPRIRSVSSELFELLEPMLQGVSLKKFFGK